MGFFVLGYFFEVRSFSLSEGNVFVFRFVNIVEDCYFDDCLVSII